MLLWGKNREIVRWGLTVFNFFAVFFHFFTIFEKKSVGKTWRFSIFPFFFSKKNFYNKIILLFLLYTYFLFLFNIKKKNGKVENRQEKPTLFFEKLKKSGKKVEKKLKNWNVKFFSHFVKINFYVNTDDFGGKSEKKW